MHVQINFLFKDCLNKWIKKLPIAALDDPSPCTTGKAFFAEGLRLCRRPNLGHSAKIFFAEGRQLRPSAKKSPRQRSLCRGPGPRQRKALGKEALCRGPWPSAKTPSAILVCWLTAAEPRQPLPRANRQALGKGF